MTALVELDAALGWLWSQLGMALLYGTLLAAITAVACRTVFRRARPAVVAALWTVVLVKFMVPLGPELPISLAAAVQWLIGHGDAPTVVLEHVARAPKVPVARVWSAGEIGWLAVQLALVAVWVVVAAHRLARALGKARQARAWARAQPLDR